jgi:hypothetical protein
MQAVPPSEAATDGRSAAIMETRVVNIAPVQTRVASMLFHWLTQWPARDMIFPPRQWRRTTVVGHEERFPRPRLNGRSRVSYETFTVAKSNGRDAPRAAIGGMPQIGRLPQCIIHCSEEEAPGAFGSVHRCGLGERPATRTGRSAATGRNPLPRAVTRETHCRTSAGRSSKIPWTLRPR